MLLRPSQLDLKRILILILLPLCLLASLSGCISNSTTNPPTEDPVVQNPDEDEDEDEDDTFTPPEETVGPTSGLKVISAGGEHSCTIKNVDDKLWCWGNNENGQLGNSSISAPVSSPRSIGSDSWQTVVTGDQHSCAIDETGTLHCWGKNDSGQVGNGTTIFQETPAAISANTDWRNVSLGTNHSCAIKDDETLWCWGSNTSFQLGHSPENSKKPSLLSKTNEDESIETEQWLASSSGNSHTCAIKDNASLWCWGGNTKSQIGQDNTTSFYSEPTALAEGSRWLSIAANGDHSCAIRDDNSLWCWGSNATGQIGNGSTENALIPTLIASDTAWDKISLGTDHSCGIKNNGSLWCWGDNSHSQLGDEETTASHIPKLISSEGWSEVSLGNQFSCAINTDNSLWCWGSNNSNQVGNGLTIDASIPTAIAIDSSWNSISSGDAHSCAIKTDNSLWCWGNSDFGQATLNVNAKTPTQEPSESSWLNVAANGNHSCAVKNDHSLWCWGFNSQGQLGNSTTTQQTIPTPVVADSNWIDLSLGLDHSCAIRDNGSLWCWGNNIQSQLGDGSIINSTTPKLIGTASNWSNISLGNQFSCGIQTDSSTTPLSQTLWCWGKNDLSQLGHIPADNKTPSQVDVAIDWQSVSAGNNHACAINSSNQSLFCWGDNSYGQLGLNNTSQATLPSQQYTASKWLGVSSGGNHTCAVQDDDSLWCWGNNSAGQLGIGTTSHQPKPQRVSHIDELDWYIVSSGKDHTCAIDSDYIGHCWGLNEFGQIGNGIALSTITAKRFDLSENWGSIDDNGDLKMGSIDSGTLHSCALKTDTFDTTKKTLWCGGINNFGQLGIGSTANQSAPVQIIGPDATAPLENWQYVSTGHFHSCAITDTGALYCWGKNSHGQLATTNNANNIGNWSLQTAISAGTSGDDWQMVAAGASHTCGIKNTDELWCWGDNFTNQMGLNSANPSDPADPGNKQISPVQVMEDGLTTPFMAKDVAIGGYTNDSDHSAGGHTCAIKTDGTLWCWGENDTSQLGEQTTTNRATPTQIIVDAAAEGFPPQFNNSWVSIKAGNRFTCGLQTDQQLYCWGDHTFGQTGTEDVAPVQEPEEPDPDLDLFPDTSVTSPKPIDRNLAVLDFAVGQRFACAINSINELWCWGFKGNSQAALDADTQRLIDHTPVRDPIRDEWQSLSLGMKHGCGIREDDELNRSVYCWGDGAEFQFGNGSAWKETPQQLSLQ